MIDGCVQIERWVSPFQKSGRLRVKKLSTCTFINDLSHSIQPFYRPKKDSVLFYNLISELTHRMWLGINNFKYAYFVQSRNTVYQCSFCKKKKMKYLEKIPNFPIIVLIMYPLFFFYFYQDESHDQKYQNTSKIHEHHQNTIFILKYHLITKTPVKYNNTSEVPEYQHNTIS